MLYMLLMAESVLVKDCKVVKNQTDRVFFSECNHASSAFQVDKTLTGRISNRRQRYKTRYMTDNKTFFPVTFAVRKLFFKIPNWGYFLFFLQLLLT